MKIVLLTILLMISTTLYADSNKTEETLKFTLTDTDSNQIHVSESEAGLTFEEYKGKAVFLVIFGHNCPPCNAEIPEFIELTKEYKDKLAIVAIEAQRYNTIQLKAFKKEKGINYSLIPGVSHDDFVGYIANRAQWNGAIPLLIALDKNGAVQMVQPGFIPKASLEILIDKLTK